MYLVCKNVYPMCRKKCILCVKKKKYIQNNKISRNKFKWAWWLTDKESTCQCRRCRKCGLNPWVGKIPWRRQWQSTPVFLPGKSHGQKSLESYSLWGPKSVWHNLATKNNNNNKNLYTKIYKILRIGRGDK